MRTVLVAVCLLFGVIAVAPVLAEPQSGAITWEKWAFGWEVQGNQSVVLTDVTFDNELVLTKASLPVIRVK